MAKPNFVKAARKDNPVAKKGESYWWWQFNFSKTKHYSKERPKPSQLTQSEFLGNVYALQEEISETQVDFPSEFDDLIEEWASRAEEFGIECQDRLDNMPEGLQQGDTGQMLQDRIDAMENWSQEIQSVDCSYDKEKDGDVEEWIQNKLDEIAQIDTGV